MGVVNNMVPSQQLIDWVKSVERFSATPYKDQGGRPTIGFGHLIKDGEVFGAISSVEATALFVKDMQPFADAINNTITVPLKQGQFDALCSFSYNVGTGWLEGSGLLSCINGNAPSVQTEIHFKAWNKVNGAVSAGLSNRRAAEWLLYSTGKFTTW